MCSAIKLVFVENSKAVKSFLLSAFIVFLMVMIIVPSDEEATIKYDAFAGVIVCVLYLLTMLLLDRRELIITVVVSFLFASIYFVFIEHHVVSSAKIFGYSIFLRSVFVFLGSKLFKDNLRTIFWIMLIANPALQLYQYLFIGAYRQKGLFEEPAHITIWVVTLLFLFTMKEQRLQRDLLWFSGLILLSSVLASSLAVFVVASLAILSAFSFMKIADTKKLIGCVFVIVSVLSIPFIERFIGTNILVSLTGIDSFHNIAIRVENVFSGLDGSTNSRLFGSLNLLIGLIEREAWFGVGISGFAQFLLDYSNGYFEVYDVQGQTVPDFKSHIFSISGFVIFGLSYFLLTIYFLFLSFRGRHTTFVFFVWMVFSLSYGGILSPAILALHAALLFNLYHGR